MFSVITPVYRNAEFITLLIAEFERVSRIVTERYGMKTEFIFVVDGSPDDSYERLRRELPKSTLRAQLVLHSRNFGAFAAIRTGLMHAEGRFFGVIAADLQEPPDLLLSFLEALHSDEYDVVVGTRSGRDDPWLSRLNSNLFWSFYRRFVIRELPVGGVDVFGCNAHFRDELLKLDEANSSLVALIFWLGFRRKEIPYKRLQRQFGRSGWSFSKKLNYLLDSIFSFTDLPIKMLFVLGILGVSGAMIFGIIVAALRFSNQIEIPGYAATVITIAFFGGLNTFGLALVGSYAWRTFENTKRRPWAVVHRHHSYHSVGNAASTIQKKVQP